LPCSFANTCTAIERQRKVIQEYFDGDGLFDDLDLTDIKTVLDWVLAAPDNGAKK